MGKSPVPPLEHILDAIGKIETIVAGKTLADLERDWVARLALERGFEIVSEASRRLPDELKRRHDEIPWRQIAGIGNILRHNYDEVRLGVLVNTVHAHLGPLQKACADELTRVRKALSTEAKIPANARDNAPSPEQAGLADQPLTPVIERHRAFREMMAAERDQKNAPEQEAASDHPSAPRPKGATDPSP